MDAPNHNHLYNDPFTTHRQQQSQQQQGPPPPQHQHNPFNTPTNVLQESSLHSSSPEELDEPAFGHRSGESSNRSSYIDTHPYTSYSYPLSRPAAARQSSRSFYDDHNNGPYSQSPPDSRLHLASPSPVPWGGEKGASSVSLNPYGGAPSPVPWNERSSLNPYSAAPSPVPWGNDKGSTVSLNPYHAASPYRSTEMLSNLIPEHQITSSGANILKLDDHDDSGRLSRWRTICWWLSPIAAAITLGSYWVYFVLRIMYISHAQSEFRQALPMAWIFVGVEITVAIPMFFGLFWTLFIWKKRDRPRLRLQGDICPTIDVLITCCKEEVDLIVDTTRAACELDYPQDRFRVVVLDDGADQDLRRALLALQDRYPNLHYRAREKIKGVPHHFKAGNLNYGIEETRLMPGGGGEFIAALDADMIPEPHWLRSVVPHIMVNPAVALACPPQLFYNIPKGDPLCQSLDFFVHVSEPIKDALGVAWCTGSGYVVRRVALMEINCFPTGSLAEDVCTSTLLLGAGWKTAYVHEPLQFGTVPDSFGAHLKQRTRWAIGTVDTALRLKFCVYGAEIARMKFWPRFSGFIYAMNAMFNIFFVVSLFTLPIVLAAGRPLIAYSNSQELHNLIYSCFICVVASRVCDIVMYAPAGYSTGQRGARSQLWMSPYFAMCMIRSFVLPSWLGGQAQSFKPTGSIKSELNERDPTLRAPLFRRLKTICFNYLGVWHILYVYFVISAVTVATSRCIVSPPAYLFQPLAQIGTTSYTTGTDDKFADFTRAQFQCLLTHAYWPPVAWLLVIASCWMPISYAIDPPDMPAREDLLVRDPKTDVARPKDECKKAGWTSGEYLYEGVYSLSTLFTIFIFVCAFFWI